MVATTHPTAHASGAKEIGSAAQRMADPDRRGEHRAAVLEQKGDVGAQRRSEAEDQSQDHGSGSRVRGRRSPATAAPVATGRDARGRPCGRNLWMFLPRRIDETWARRERDRRRSNPLALALSVRSFAVQLGVAPLRRGCPLRPVSLERLGVTVVSCSASLTRRGGAERSLRPLAHLVRMHKRLAGTLLGAPQASPRILSHSAPLSRRPHRQEPGRGVGEQRRRDLTPALSLALSVPSQPGVATPLRIRSRQSPSADSEAPPPSPW